MQEDALAQAGVVGVAVPASGEDLDRNGQVLAVGRPLDGQQLDRAERQPGCFLGEFAAQRRLDGGVLRFTAATQQTPLARRPDAREVVAQVQQVLAAAIVDDGGGVHRLRDARQARAQEFGAQLGRGHLGERSPLGPGHLFPLETHGRRPAVGEVEDEAEVVVLVRAFVLVRVRVDGVDVDVHGGVEQVRREAERPGRDPGLLGDLADRGRQQGLVGGLAVPAGAQDQSGGPVVDVQDAQVAVDDDSAAGDVRGQRGAARRVRCGGQQVQQRLEAAQFAGVAFEVGAGGGGDLGGGGRQSGLRVRCRGRVRPGGPGR